MNLQQHFFEDLFCQIKHSRQHGNKMSGLDFLVQSLFSFVDIKFHSAENPKFQIQSMSTFKPSVVGLIFRSSCLWAENTNQGQPSHDLHEPRHDKTNKMSVRPAKTQISLGGSESSLCAQWVAKDQSFLHADSEDSEQTGRMLWLICVFAGRTLILLVLSCRGSHVDFR